MSLAFLLLAQAAATPAATPYPTESVLEAFGGACRSIKDIDQVEADLQEQQWTAAIPPEDSPLGRLLAMGRAGAALILNGPNDRMSATRVFTKTVSGERLDIIISRVETEGTFVNGCRMYDVDETRMIDQTEAEKWIGRDADKVMDRAEITVANWEPGYAKGHDSFEIFYVPTGSPIIALTQFNGLALKADFVGEMED